MSTPTAFTFIVSYDPHLGYSFHEQTNDGGTGGASPHLVPILDELFNSLFRHGHGNRSHYLQPELDPDPDPDDDGFVCPRCHGTRTIQPDRMSPPEDCDCVDPDAGEDEPSLIVFAPLAPPRDSAATYGDDEPF